MTSRKFTALRPASMVILNPNSLIFDRNCLLSRSIADGEQESIIARPSSRYRPYSQELNMGDMALNKCSPIRSHISAPWNEPIGVSSSPESPFLTHVLSSCTNTVLHACNIMLMSVSSMLQNCSANFSALTT